ncbi:MAG: hypothetical protein QMD82_00040 [bacterium]|nr:hypothetical protein [bacterium]
MLKSILVAMLISSYRPGVGLILGIPTGLNLNFESKANAINSTLSWGIPDIFYFSLGYHENFRIETGEDIEGLLRVYLGGAFLFKVTRDNAKMGIKIPLGMKFLFDNLPIDVFAEVSPGIHLIPETSPLIEGALGLRFYLDRLKVSKE